MFLRRHMPSVHSAVPFASATEISTHSPVSILHQHVRRERYPRFLPHALFRQFCLWIGLGFMRLVAAFLAFEINFRVARTRVRRTVVVSLVFRLKTFNDTHASINVPSTVK